MDLVFILDSSSAVGAANWTALLNVVAQLIDVLNVSPTATNVGVVAFSDAASVPIRLDSFTDGASLTAAVLKLTYVPGASNVNLGLAAARTLQFTQAAGDRADVPDVAVLITVAGASGFGAATLAEASRCHQAGIAVYAVGIGVAAMAAAAAAATATVGGGGVSTVASHPHIEYHQWWKAAGFDRTSLTAVLTELADELCRPQLGE